MQLNHPEWSPALRAELNRLLAGPAALAAFDFDDTILDGDISHALLSALEEQRGEPLMARYRTDLQHDVHGAWLRLAATLVAGCTVEEVRAQTCAALAAGLADGSLRLRVEIAELMRLLAQAGWQVWIVTASAAEVVRAAARALNLAHTGLLGLEVEVYGGRFTEEVCGHRTFGAGKLTALRDVVGLAPGFAAGDSTSDVPMLAAARVAMVVGDAPLMQAEARKRGWHHHRGRARRNT